jgi:hypothetical protein
MRLVVFGGAGSLVLALLPLVLVGVYKCLQKQSCVRLNQIFLALCFVFAWLAALALAIVEGVFCNQLSNWHGVDQSHCWENFVAAQNYFYPFYAVGVLQIVGVIYGIVLLRRHNLTYGSYFLLSTSFKVIFWLLVVLLFVFNCLGFILPAVLFEMLVDFEGDFIPSSPFGWNS